MARSLPERTVDAWVTACLCSRFPSALIWGPTQNNPDTNWDFGADLGLGKAFILENKATEPGYQRQRRPLPHRVTIDHSQLDWYCDQVEPDHGVPVYYVLPHPPWEGRPTGWSVLPDQARHRHTFSDWAWVMRCHHLRSWLKGRGSFNTELLPFTHLCNLEGFLNQVWACRLGRRLDAKAPARQRARDIAALEIPERARVEPQLPAAEGGDFIGSALAVFLPAESLPNLR